MQQRTAVWTVVAPLVAFKLWATVLLLAMEPSRDALGLVLATGWPWLVVVLLLAAAPTAAWIRRARVRARREQLRRQEGLLEAPPTGEARRPPPAPQWPLWETVSRLEGRDD